MRRLFVVLCPVVATPALVLALWMFQAPLVSVVSAQQPTVNPPLIPFDSVPDFFKYSDELAGRDGAVGPLHHEYPTQYLYTADSEPGRVYKLTLDGKILGMLGESGHELGQLNWPHGLACPSENEVYVADMNNWREQKLILHPDRQKPTTAARH